MIEIAITFIFKIDHTFINIDDKKLKKNMNKIEKRKSSN